MREVNLTATIQTGLDRKHLADPTPVCWCSNCGFMLGIDNIQRKCPKCTVLFINNEILKEIPDAEYKEVINGTEDEQGSEQWVVQTKAGNCISWMDLRRARKRRGPRLAQKSQDKGKGQGSMDMSNPWGLRAEVLFTRDLFDDKRPGMPPMLPKSQCIKERQSVQGT